MKFEWWFLIYKTISHTLTQQGFSPSGMQKIIPIIVLDSWWCWALSHIDFIFHHNSLSKFLIPIFEMRKAGLRQKELNMLVSTVSYCNKRTSVGWREQYLFLFPRTLQGENEGSPWGRHLSNSHNRAPNMWPSRWFHVSLFLGSEGKRESKSRTNIF